MVRLIHFPSLYGLRILTGKDERRAVAIANGMFVGPYGCKSDLQPAGKSDPVGGWTIEYIAKARLRNSLLEFPGANGSLVIKASQKTNSR